MQPRSVRVRKSAYDKKLWNATARHLSDLVGMTTLFHVAIGAIVMGVLALVTGILILVGK